MFVKKIICFFCRSALIKFMQKFEYESIYDTKTLSKTFFIRKWNTCNNMHHFPKVKGDTPTPPQKQYSTSFLFNPVKFQESNYSSQLFHISLFKEI